jgi:hypothetical protein
MGALFPKARPKNILDKLQEVTSLSRFSVFPPA